MCTCAYPVPIYIFTKHCNDSLCDFSLYCAPYTYMYTLGISPESKMEYCIVCLYFTPITHQMQFWFYYERQRSHANNAMDSAIHLMNVIVRFVHRKYSEHKMVLHSSIDLFCYFRAWVQLGNVKFCDQILNMIKKMNAHAIVNTDNFRLQ